MKRRTTFTKERRQWGSCWTSTTAFLADLLKNLLAKFLCKTPQIIYWSWKMERVRKNILVESIIMKIFQGFHLVWFVLIALSYLCAVVVLLLPPLDWLYLGKWVNNYFNSLFEEFLDKQVSFLHSKYMSFRVEFNSSAHMYTDRMMSLGMLRLMVRNQFDSFV